MVLKSYWLNALSKNLAKLFFSFLNYFLIYNFSVFPCKFQQLNTIFITCDKNWFYNNRNKQSIELYFHLKCFLKIDIFKYIMFALLVFIFFFLPSRVVLKQWTCLQTLHLWLISLMPLVREIKWSLLFIQRSVPGIPSL